MKNVQRNLIFLLLVVFVFAFSLSAFSRPVSVRKLNKEVFVKTQAKEIVLSGYQDSALKEYLKRSTYKYIAVVKFSVTPGASYTFYAKYPMDGVGRGYTFTGENPLRSRGGSTSFQVPDSSREKVYNCKYLTRRDNIKISEDSNSDLVIIYTSSKPDIPIIMLLKSPQDPDKVVDGRAPYPGCNPDMQFFWGFIWKNSLLLYKD